MMHHFWMVVQQREKNMRLIDADELKEIAYEMVER